MKALLLNASPKNYGATQEILNIVKNQLPSYVSAELLCLGDMNIAYCMGDKTCYDTCKCIQHDDMDALVEKIDDADILIIAAPSYWADVPGQFKVFIDRCTVYSETNPNPDHRVLKTGKKCYGIALRTGTRPAECEHIIETIAHWCGHMKIDMIDSMYFCTIKDKNDVTKITDAICAKTNEWFRSYTMNLRIAEPNDTEKILSVLESGRKFLQAQGLSQWQDGYGPSQYVEEDIANNWGYVFITPEGTICGYAALVEGVDECYTNIKDGSWDTSHEKYISIHSVAIDAEFRGKNLTEPFMRRLIEIAETIGYRDIRIDTHPSNEIMQKVIIRAGFAYRGMVEFAIPDGKRKAYQLILV